MPETSPPRIEDVRDAATRLAGHAVQTPLLRSDAIDAATKARIFFKAECLQVTGSFKFRGAYNRLSALSEKEREAGIVAFSSGNHAQGVARAALLLGMPAAIVMPRDAPPLKVERTRADGAEIIFYDRITGPREEIAAALAAERGAILVPSFDDPHIVAGQGTAGLESAAQLAAFGLAADAIIACCGGGGLASGLALALPEAALWLAEPAGYDDAGESLRTGTIVPVTHAGPTLCDALQTFRIAPLTYDIMSRAGARGVAVSDADVAQAMRTAFTELKVVVEPGGAAALAALLSGKIDVEGQVVLATLSGGNVDPALFAKVLTS
ncbi:threonine/serine dehydratase [Pacificimonas sp. WHA3]|uniref:Threonine/serine dehydratase n=1 Tax=Pacificimonas pallii TaxID=2827236 RepID=A0ABS6SF51_9SPHN|nr:threonine/serine dehydratase [Pacificimonas pallii]MBV7256728.1 threonine/serine dehydratase [Pacificimonas pallii]